MPEKWVGSDHCVARVHCAACLGTDEYSVNWRAGMRGENYAPPVFFDMLPEGKLMCPCDPSVTLAEARAEAIERAADGFVTQNQAFLDRLAKADKADALVDLVAGNRLSEEVAVRVSEKLNLEAITPAPK